MPGRFPYTSPTIMAAHTPATSKIKTSARMRHADDAMRELVEMAKFFGSLMLIYMLTGLAIIILARFAA